LVLGLALLVAPGLSWAQRPPTPTPTPVVPVAPIVQPKPTQTPAPSPAVVTVESDMPLCSDLTDVLPNDVSVKNVDCKSEVGLACVNSITFYGASIACSSVFVKPPNTPTPLPAPAN
jgi:hypothetical protein